LDSLLGDTTSVPPRRPSFIAVHTGSTIREIWDSRPLEGFRMKANSRTRSFLRDLRLPRKERAAARAERARIAADVQRGRERSGEVGKYGVSDNTGYGGPGM
jgi:hypothetical protein